MVTQRLVLDEHMDPRVLRSIDTRKGVPMTFYPACGCYRLLNRPYAADPGQELSLSGAWVLCAYHADLNTGLAHHPAGTNLR